MANIGSRLFNLLADKYLTLANEEWVRTLAIGNDWNKLRLGLLLAVTPDGTNPLGGTALMLGLCSGKTNPYGAASTTNFVGAALHGSTPGATTGTLSYVAGAGNPYFTSGGSWPGTRVGGVYPAPRVTFGCVMCRWCITCGEPCASAILMSFGKAVPAAADALILASFNLQTRYGRVTTQKPHPA
mgnify:CR=1 FL=1